MRTLPIWLVLAGCEPSLPDAEPLTIELTSPEYGAFLGDGPIKVEGIVSHPQATVTVADREVVVCPDGTFSTWLPFTEARYRVVDVEAFLYDGTARERIPVFDGSDPIDAWPGGITGRLSPDGLEALGEGIGAMIDDLGWDDMIMDALPSIESEYITFTPVGVTHDDTVVELIPSDDGLETAVSIRDVLFEADIEIAVSDFTWDGTLGFGFGEIALGALLVPTIDDDGIIWLVFEESIIDLDDPTVEIDGVEEWLVALLLEGASFLIEAALEGLIDIFLDELGDIEIGGPFEFETDLMGTELGVRLSDLYTDDDGVALEVGVGIGEPVSDEKLGIPVPSGDLDSGEEWHLGLGVHEGILANFLSDDLLSMLEQELVLEGTMGDLLGAGIEGLPGGSGAPDDSDGWCMALEPGPAKVIRFQEGIDPLAVLYLPDVDVNISTLDGSTCVPWLETNLSLEVGIEVSDGTMVSIDMGVGDGAVLYYATTRNWEEEALVDDLGSYIGTLMSLLGGTLEFDLAELFGGLDTSGTDQLGLFENLEPEIVDSVQLYDEEGEPVEGLFGIVLRLWAEDA